MIAAVVFFALLACAGLWIGKRAARSKPEPPQPGAMSAPDPPAREYPQKVGTSCLRYQYDFELVPEPESAALIRDAAAQESELILSAEEESILVSRGGLALGHIADEHKAQMLSDFIARREPVLAYMRRDAVTVHVLFYRDYRPGNAWREQVVVPLIPYYSADAQRALLQADFDRPLNFGDTRVASDTALAYDTDDVRIGQTKIGRLPEELAKKYPYLIYLERLEEEQQPGKTFYVPIVRLYFAHPEK